MKRDISLWQFAGFVLTVLGGTLLHFLYDWANNSILVAPFSAVNESTWEHMKLLYFPMFIFALVQSRFFAHHENFWCIKMAGILTGLILIPVLFYTYNGVLGKSTDWVNIAIFFICALVAFWLESWLLKKENFKCMHPRVCFLVICFIGALFIIFTFFTPKIPLFKDPIHKKYGINL